MTHLLVLTAPPRRQCKLRQQFRFSLSMTLRMGSGTVQLSGELTHDRRPHESDERLRRQPAAAIGGDKKWTFDPHHAA